MNIKMLPLYFLKEEERGSFIKDFVVSLFENEFNRSCELKFNQWKDMGKTLKVLVTQSLDKIGVKNVIFTTSDNIKYIKSDVDKFFNILEPNDLFGELLFHFTNNKSFITLAEQNGGNIEVDISQNSEKMKIFLYELEQVGGFVEFESVEYSFFKNIKNDVIRKSYMSMDEINTIVEKEKNIYGVNFNFMIDPIVSLSMDYNTVSHFKELKGVIHNAFCELNGENSQLREKYDLSVIYNDIDYEGMYGDAKFLFMGKNGNIIALIELYISRYQPDYIISIFDEDQFNVAVKEIREIINVTEKIEVLKKNCSLNNIKKVNFSDFTDNPLKFSGRIGNAIYSK